MGEFEITIKCAIPGNIEGFTPNEVFIECLNRTHARGVWAFNKCKTQWGEITVDRIR